MRAIVLDSGPGPGRPPGPGIGPRVRDDLGDPEPGAGEVLVRVDRAGVCGTDLALIEGYKGGFRGVLGHEFVGTVVAGDPAWRGRRVTASINIGCGRCDRCLTAGPEHCRSRTVLGILGRDGAFADYLAVPAANLFAVPDGVPDEAAVFAEPLAAAVRVGEQVAVGPGQRVAVVGPGRLGMLVARILALAGGAVTVVGRRRESLALAREWGMDVAMTGAAELAGGFGLVVEATGAPAGFAEAVRLVEARGTLVQKSTFASAVEVDVSKLVVDEIRLIGSRCGPFAPALELLADGAVDVTRLIDAEYPLGDGLAALRRAASPGVRKVLLRPGGR